MSGRWLVLALLVLVAARADAHQSAVKYADVTVDGSRITIALTIAPADATGPLGLADDAEPTVADVLAPSAVGKVSAYVATWISVRQPSGASCNVTDPAAEADADGRFVVVTWTATCSDPIDELVLDFTRFFDVDQRHEAIVTVHAPGEQTEPVLMRAALPTLTVDLGGSLSMLQRVAIALGLGLAGVAVAGVVLVRRRRRASRP
ncbi:MAG: hypothetical protein JWP01_3331 [Myxococcales bacterium]|nr:hypothetical protein [Myxococcales bacterium]